MSYPELSKDDSKIDPRVWKVLGVVLLGPFMTQIDSTVVNFSLSAIREELHASIASTQWIISGYLLALALMLPLNGWLVDRIGAKRLYLICFSAFTFASILCGASHTIDALIWSRVFQGIAGGLLAPMTQMMVARVAGKHMARVVGYASIPILLAPILGPVLAGAILKNLSWSWLFYINLPVGIIAVSLAWILLPNDHGTSERRPFDFLGFLLISPGLASFLFGIEKISHGEGALVFIVGITLIALFIAHAYRAQAKALIDIFLFKNKVFTAAAVTQFLANGATFAGQFLVPLFLITGFKFTPTEAGWMMAPMGFGMLCTYPIMGILTEKFGCRAVATTGSIVNILGTFPFLWMTDHGFSKSIFIACLIARGAGQGGIGIPSMSAAYASVPKEKLPVATTAINIVQRIGGPIATTIMAMIMASASTHTQAHDPHAFVTALIVLNGIQFFVLVGTLRLPIWIHAKEK